METRSAPPIFRVPTKPQHALTVTTPAVYRLPTTPPVQKKAANGAGLPPTYRPDLSVQFVPTTIRPGSAQSAVQPSASFPALPSGARTKIQQAVRGFRPPRVNSTVQRYGILPANRIFASEEEIIGNKRAVAVIPNENGNFVWQQKHNGTFLGNNDEEANLVNLSRVQLRVSDDWEMAIQDTDLSNEQPKVFYATDNVFLDSQTKLQEVKSKLKLVKGTKVLTLWDGSSNKHQLTQLIPQSVQSPVEQPLMLRSKQYCNEMSEQVTGTWIMEMYPTSTYRLPVRDVFGRVEWGGLGQIAALVAELMGTSKGGQGERLADALDQVKPQIIQEIAVEYNRALSSTNQEKLDDILKQLKINQYASPEVGDAFVIGSVAAEDKQRRLTDLQTGNRFVPKWPYHFGGVVARSGSDRVTLENYARKDEGLGNPMSDPRWYFQMYGVKQGQSFHEANYALGGYANPVTSAYHNEDRSELIKPSREVQELQIQQDELQRRKLKRRELQRLQMMKKVKIGGFFVTLLLLGIALSYLHRYKYI